MNRGVTPVDLFYRRKRWEGDYSSSSSSSSSSSPAAEAEAAEGDNNNDNDQQQQHQRRRRTIADYYVAYRRRNTIQPMPTTWLQRIFQRTSIWAAITSLTTLSLVFCIVAFVLFNQWLGNETSLLAANNVVDTVLGVADSSFTSFFLRVSDVNYDVLAYFQLAYLDLATQADGMAHDLLNALRQSEEKDAISSLYVGDNAGYLVELSVIGSNNNNNSNETTISIVDAATAPLEYTFPVDGSCSPTDVSCSVVDRSAPIGSPQEFVPSEQSWFALSAAASPMELRWSDTYVLHPEDVIRITSAISTRRTSRTSSSSTTITVIAADVSLSSFHEILSQIPKEFGYTASQLSVVMVDSNGYVVAATSENALLLKESGQDGCSLECLACCRRRPDDPVFGISEEIRHLNETEPHWLDNNCAEIVSVFNSSTVIFVRCFQQPANSKNPSISWTFVAVLSKGQFLLNLQYTFRVAVPILAVSLLVVIAVVIFFSIRYMVRPLRNVTKQLLAVSKLDMASNKKLSVRKFEVAEVRQLKDALDYMRSDLTSFARYVSFDVIQLQLKYNREAELGLENAEVTLLFSDIANFSTISESLEPSMLVQLLSEYLTEMSQIIHSTSGVVDKYIGDVIMAFWNMPMMVEDHALVACEAVIKCSEALTILNDDWRNRGLPVVGSRFGVHTADVLVGNVGGEDRLNFTCIGDNVNLASRIHGLNKLYKTSAIITGAVNELVKDRFATRPVDLVVVKGKQNSVPIFELINRRSDLPPAFFEDLALYQLAYDAFLEGNFALAISRFEAFLRVQPNDATSLRHINTAREMLRCPPDHWDGIARFHEK